MCGKGEDPVKEKHGLSQYRLNNAKNYSQIFVETTINIEMMFQLSLQGVVDEELAEGYIKRNIESLDRDWKYFKSYIEQRDDMR